MKVLATKFLPVPLLKISMLRTDKFVRHSFAKNVISYMVFYLYLFILEIMIWR